MPAIRLQPVTITADGLLQALGQPIRVHGRVSHTSGGLDLAVDPSTSQAIIDTRLQAPDGGERMLVRVLGFGVDAQVFEIDRNEELSAKGKLDLHVLHLLRHSPPDSSE